MAIFNAGSVLRAVGAGIGASFGNPAKFVSGWLSRTVASPIGAKAAWGLGKNLWRLNFDKNFGGRIGRYSGKAGRGLSGSISSSLQEFSKHVKFDDVMTSMRYDRAQMHKSGLQLERTIAQGLRSMEIGGQKLKAGFGGNEAAYTKFKRQYIRTMTSKIRRGPVEWDTFAADHLDNLVSHEALSESMSSAIRAGQAESKRAILSSAKTSSLKLARRGPKNQIHDYWKSKGVTDFQQAFKSSQKAYRDSLEKAHLSSIQFGSQVASNMAMNIIPALAVPTYAARLAMGRNAFKNSSNKVDVLPFVPIL